jgi:hypothetical protein
MADSVRCGILLALCPFLVTTFMLGGGAFLEAPSRYIPTVCQFIRNVGAAMTVALALQERGSRPCMRCEKLGKRATAFASAC